MEWLERVEEELEDIGVSSEEITTIQEWRQTLLEEFGYNERQIEALWEFHEYHWDKLAKYGIRKVVYVYRTGPREGQREVRWVVKGHPGLWSWEHAKEWYEELSGGGE